MKYKLVSDSGCDMNKDLKKTLDCTLVPLKISVDNLNFVDRDLDTKLLLGAIALSKNAAKTACPSPDEFLTSYGADEDTSVFAITISSKLSGSFNSAVLAKDLLLEEHPTKNIHVFDSLSASAGQTLIALTIDKLVKLGGTFEEIVEKTENFIKEMKTYFVLENLDTLIKAGRISKLKGAFAAVLSFRPIMGSDSEGNIKLYENMRGTFNALTRLADIVAQQCGELRDTLVISHCNNADRANFLKDRIQKTGVNLKEILIVETAGLSTTYANDGGIVVAF